MSLNPREQEIFDLTESDFDSVRSPEARASWDFRLSAIVDFLEGVPDTKEKDYQIICDQIMYDYMLDEDSLVRALQLNKIRRPLGEA